MKIACVFLLCLLAFTFAQQPELPVLQQWSGTTEQGALFNAPTVNGAACIGSTDTRNYVVMNYTFGSDGTRQIGVLATNKPRVEFYVYKTSFSAAAPCNNLYLRRKLGNQQGPTDLGVLSISDPVYFTAGTYFFVATSDLAGQTYKFGLTIYGSYAFGTTVGAPTWNPPYYAPACAPGPNAVALGVQTFMAPETVNLDISVIFAVNDSAALGTVYFAIYIGSFTADQIRANPCTTGSPSAAQEGDSLVTALNYLVTRGLTYTIAVGAAVAGNYAIQVAPTKVNIVGTGGIPVRFAQPNRMFPPCTANASATTSSSYTRSFTATSQQYLFDTYSLPSYSPNPSFPVVAFVYSGLTPTPNQPLETCPSGTPLYSVVKTQSVASPLVISTQIGRAYTVVFANANGDLNSVSAVQVFEMSGVWVGNPAAYIPDPNAPTPPPTPPPTPAPTNPPAATTGSTGSNNTTGKLTSSTSTSSASTVLFSVTLVIVSCLAFIL